ncbi:MAG: FtsK/SpoIIIE family DNA translocase [Bacillota bacterium]
MPRVVQQAKEQLKHEITGIGLVALAILGGASLFTVETGSWPYSAQAIGPIGKFLEWLLRALSGEGRYFLPVIIGIWGVQVMRRRKKATGNVRMFGIAGIYLVALATLHLPLVLEVRPVAAIKQGIEGVGGGLLGSLLASLLAVGFGRIGGYILLITLGIVSLLLLTNASFATVAQWIWVRLAKFYFGLRDQLVNFLFTTEAAEEELVALEEVSLPENSGSRRARRPRKPNPMIMEEPHGQDQEAIEAPALKIYPQWTGNQPEPSKPVQRTKTEQSLPTLKESGSFGEEEKDMQPVKAGDFVLPPMTLLQRSLRLKNPRMNKDITDRVKLLEDTLESFGVKVKVTQVTCGPAITRYEVQPAPGVKVSRIVSLADDIALSLAAPDVRIEAPIPGKAAVGIEVPNREIAMVHFREVLETPEFQESSSKLTVALGKDITGYPILADLTKMPHMLIAGATGSGKSVCLNSLICSLLFKSKPAELKILMIDPKMVELSNFNGIPHLITPVVTDPKKAATALRWMVNEMENRYEVFAAAGVKDVLRYNALKARENPDLMDPALPNIVVIIDELADLMMVAPADVEDAICRLAQMARAAGIHLVVATQRPSVDVITGVIKANIPSRIAFAVSSQTDSRTILDIGGAEKLMGRGDMLYFPVGASKPIRVQGVYVSDKEVDDIVTFLKHQGKPRFEEGILDAETTAPPHRETEDELLPEAVRLLIESGQASISMLQRRLRIGYTRAARLMDIMEEQGIVGGYEGSKPRAVLIGWDEYERVFGKSAP